MGDFEFNPLGQPFDLVNLSSVTPGSDYPIFTFNSLTNKLSMETEEGDTYVWVVEAIENFTIIGGAENFTLIGGTENFTMVQ